MSFDQLSRQPGSVVCAGCRDGAALSARRLSIPCRARCSCGLCQTAPQPRVSICQGFSHHRMQSGWEKLGECDLKSPGWVWDTKGQCPRQSQLLQRGLGSALCPERDTLGNPGCTQASPSSCHLSHAGCCSSAHPGQSSASQLGTGRSPWTSSCMGKSPPKKTQTQVSESKTLLIQSEILFLASPGSFQIGWGSFTKGKPRCIVVCCERCFDPGPEQMSAAFRQSPADGKKPPGAASGRRDPGGIQLIH